jgi:hypothetical protein
MHKIILLLLFLTSCKSQPKEFVTKLIKETHQLQSKEDKTSYIAHKLIDKPYIANPLGDGKDAIYNQKGIYSIDGFDCLTFIEFVTSLSYAKNFSDFENIIKDLKYADKNIPSFINRNHFTSIDWQKNNIAKNYFYDLNPSININLSYLTKEISKKDWYKKQGLTAIHRPDLEEIEKKKLLMKLQNEGEKFTNIKISYPYISKEYIQEKNVKFLIKNLPKAFIIFVVKDNNYKNNIGTDIIITHTGIGIKEENEIYFIHASTVNKKVEKVKLTEYFKKYQTSSAQIGISLLGFAQ